MSLGVVERDITNTVHEPRRRRSRSARSPSVSRSSPAGSIKTTSSKRSPSPIISFHPAPLSAENAKGVKNITRKVIKRLEGLGHLEMVDVGTLHEEEEGDGEEVEVEKVLREVIKSANESSIAQNGNALQNGNANGNIVKLRKLWTDLEVPRKALHSSIGFFTLYLYISEGNVQTIVLALWTALAVIVPGEILRFKSRRFAKSYERVLGFLMRESEKNSINGVVWYILGVNFVLTFYPQDVATVAILILSWADTAASTVGRLLGVYTPKLPSRLPFLRLPLAPRKSLAGFLAASATAATITAGFWSYISPMRDGGRAVTWAWEGGVQQAIDGAPRGVGAGGALGLLVIAVVAGVVSGIAEALDLGSLDDNLTLPIIAGGCILGFLKVLGAASQALSSAGWFS